MNNELIVTSIGKIAGTHGLDGWINLSHQLIAKNAFSKIKFIFIEIRKESFIPFYIEQKRSVSDDEICLKLEDVVSVEQAKELSGKKVFIEQSLFVELNPQSISNTLIGYQIHDEKLGIIGPIEELIETPGQVLAYIQYRSKEVLIPLVDATLKKMDHVRKLVYVCLPDGLLEIYE